MKLLMGTAMILILTLIILGTRSLFNKFAPDCTRKSTDSAAPSAPKCSGEKGKKIMNNAVNERIPDADVL